MILGALLVALSCSVAEVTTRVGWIDVFEYAFYDLCHNLSRVRFEPEHVVIVAIDNETLLNHRDEPLVFWGPHFARAIKNLRRAGAQIIGLDYVFTASAESWLRKIDLPGTEESRTYDIPMRAQLSAGQVVLTGTLTETDHGESEVILPIKDYLFVLPGGLADVGLTNFYTDTDGMVRRFVPALFDDDRMPTLTFATLLAIHAAGLDPLDNRWSLGDHTIPKAPLPRRIGFVGPPGTVPRLSFGRLLTPDADKDPDIQSVKSKVVIVASEHAGMQDIHLSPYAQGLFGMAGRVMTGAELHANIVETLLTGRFPRSVPNWLRVIYLVALLVTGTVVFFRLRPWLGLATGLLFGLGGALFSYILFQINWVMPVTNLHLALAICYFGILGLRVTGEERERDRLRQMFGQYVSDEVVEKLLATGDRPDLGGEALQVTILFADIRGFTKISERLSAHQVVEMLNAYLDRMCEPILEQGGTVDKFIGDAVMAIFGSPVRLKNHARPALRAALEMAATAKKFQAWMNQRFSEPSLPEFSIGIGLHTGVAVIGNIGSPKRTEFTAIGDTVNAASRLEGMTRELGWTIAASGATIEAAGSGVITGQKKQVSLKGRVKPIQAFEVIGLEANEGGQP